MDTSNSERTQIPEGVSEQDYDLIMIDAENIFTVQHDCGNPYAFQVAFEWANRQLQKANETPEDQ